MHYRSQLYRINESGLAETGVRIGKMRIMTISKSRLWILLVLSLVTVSLLSACGGGDDGDSGASTSGAGEAAAPAAAAAPAKEAAKAAPATSAPEPTKAAATAKPATAVPAKPTTVPTATAVAAPITQMGNVVYANFDVGTPSGLPRDCPFCGRLGQNGVGEMLLATIRGDSGFEEVEGLASEWTLASDKSYTDFKIRSGVEFHDGWGELTAADVVWSYNESNPSITTESTHDQGGELLTFLADGVPAEVVDGDTARIFWSDFSITTTYPKTVTPFFDAIPVFSKKVFDDKGADWMRENVIATGPFQVDTWVEADRMVVKAIPKHWRVTATIGQFTVLEVPEPAVRRAMLETGEADIAALGSTDKAKLLAGSGYAKAPEGAVLGFGIIMGGNYLETVHPSSGSTLEREVPVRPWVDVIGDAAASERARKVRTALAIDIDREGLVEGLFSGNATIAYLGGVQAVDKLYMANESKYKIDFDPDAAKAMMVDAGYPDGFDVGFYARGSGEDRDRIVQAVCAQWSVDLNVKCLIDNSPYAAYRPNYINRTSYELSLRSGGSKEPATWSNEWYVAATSSTPDGTAGGGFNSGAELVMASEVLKRKAAAASLDELAEITIDWMDYLYESQMWVGTLEIADGPVYSTTSICKWDMFPLSAAGARNPETIVLCN
jgi:ABC-type transport system substrate-binding protein